MNLPGSDTKEDSKKNQLCTLAGKVLLILSLSSEDWGQKEAQVSILAEGSLTRL